MNSVHEPGPNGDSKISPSRKPVRKTKPDAQAPNRPSRHAQVRTGGPRRAHGRRIVTGSLAVSWQGAGCVAGPSGRIAASLPHAPRGSACAPAPSASACSPRTLARSAYRAPRAPAARPASCPGSPSGSVVSWLPQRRGLATGRVATRLPAQPPSPLSQYTYCIAIQWPKSFKCVAIHLSLPKPLSTCNTTWCIAIQSLANYHYCNTTPALQYNFLFSSGCNTILAHNTIPPALAIQLGNSPTHIFCTKFFFFLVFFFIINIFIYLFPTVGKITKNH